MIHRVRLRDRLAAAAALLLLLAALALAVGLVAERFPGGLVVIGLIAAAVGSAWYGLVGAGPARALGFAGAVLALAFCIAFLVSSTTETEQVLVLIAVLALATASARRAFSLHVPLAAAEPPRHGVLFLNPKSGGGKAERFEVADEARARGIEPVELGPDDDLGQLVREAVERGADGLAMAGGDGSQAVVAAAAAEADLAYACIPAGTRNHFALDLGVDREDVVGALDAFVDGGERLVDLAEVNGRVFVNNVSLGVYAEAVQRKGYREAKLRTILSTVPDLLRPDGEGLDLQWTSPGGHQHSSGAAILVSNNRYRLGRAVGAGTRPSIDDGLLGITVVSAPAGRGERHKAPQRPWRQWSQAEFVVESDKTVPAGIDGEAASLEPPLRFTIKPGVLRVRISKHHPGASPSAAIPEGVLEGFRALIRIAMGQRP